MSWYALTKIEDAVNETKDFLTPFDLGIWTRMAVLTLLIGGGMSNINPPTGTTDSGTSGTGFSGADVAFSGSDMTASMHQGLMPQNMLTGAFSTATGLSIAAVVLAAAVIIGLMVLSTVARFMYFQAAMEKDVKLRRMFRENFTNGLQLIGFSILVLLVAMAPLAPYIAGLTFASAAGVAVLVLAVLYWVALAVVMTFINDFGLPLMISENINILQASKRALGAVRREKAQAAIYFLTKIAIGITVGIIGFVAMLVVLLALLIPFGILGVIAYLITPAAGAAVAIIGLLVLVVVMLYVRVPLETYKHYFYLLNLEEFEEVELVER